MALLIVVFALMDAIYLRPLPVPAQDSLFRLYQFNPSTQRAAPGISAAAFERASGARSFEQLGAAERISGGVVIGESGKAFSAAAARVTPNYFDVIGVRPVLGRTFIESDVSVGGVIVIAYSLWQSRLGGDSTIVGRATFVDGAPAVIVGVLGPGVDVPDGTDAWLPLDRRSIALAAARDRTARYEALARLRRGVDRAAADAELSARYAAGERSARESQLVSRLVSLREETTESWRRQLALWWVAAITIALLCALNFATLSFARGLRRRGELATRAALGASPRRLAALLLAESTLVAVVSAALALVLARWLLGARHLWFDESFTTLAPVMNWRSLAFGLLATVGIGFLFALAPSLQLARADLRTLVATGGLSSTAGAAEIRGRRGPAALQLGLSLASIALVAALFSAMQDQERRGPGYEHASVVTANVLFPDSASRQSSERSLVEFARGLPSVLSAALLRSPDPGATGFRPATSALSAGVQWHDVSDEFFDVVGVKPVAGRLFLPEEVSARSPVLVVSRTTAEWVFGRGVDPLHQRVAMVLPGQRRETWFTVIGIVPDMRFGPDFLPGGVANYTTQAVSAGGRNSILLMRLRGGARSNVSTLRDALAGHAPGVVVSDVVSVDSQINRWLGRSRGRVAFFGLVALLATVLATLGVYGLASHSAEVRLREIAIRLALGASRTQIARTMIGDFGLMAPGAALIGLVVGGRLVFLVDAALRDPLLPLPILSFQLWPAVAAACGLLMIGVLATLAPLRRVITQDVAGVLHAS